MISDFDTNATTVLRVVRYDAGTNFAKPLDSTDRILPDPFNVGVPADDTKDYEIVVLPQNRRHKLANVHFGNEKRKGSPGLDSEQCTTSINFTFDGEQMTMKMAVGGTGGYTHLKI
jgi:hypothetical protein